jgi:ribosomal protein L37E
MIYIPDISVCYHCKKKDLNPEEKFCPDCGFPQLGTQEEQRNFILGHRIKKSNLREAKTNIIRARNYLFGTALLSFISFLNAGSIGIIIGLIMAAIYVGLGFWSNTKPFPAFLTGLIVYVTLIVFFGILEPLTLLSALFWKIAIIGALSYGLYSVKDVEKLEKEVELPNN